jgi:hypothetical protein
VALLVAAALVFAVVSWERIGALGQGAILVGLTGTTAWATRWAARRGLAGTAEALGVLTVLLGPLLAQAVRISLDLPSLDDRSWANWAAWSWWPGVLTLIGLAANTFGRRVGIRSAPFIGVVVLQLAVPVWVALAPVSPFVVALILAAQAGVVATGPTRAERAGHASGLWDLGSVVVWLLALFVAVGSAAEPQVSAADRWGATVALASCAAAAIWSMRRPPDGVPAGWLAAAAALAGYLAGARALGGWVPDVAFWPALGVVAVGGLWGSDRVDGPQGDALRAVSSLVAALAAWPVADVVGSVVVAAGSDTEPWRGAASAQLQVVSESGLSPAWVSLVGGAAVLGLSAVVVRARLGRDRLVIGAWLVGSATVLALPAAVGVTVGVALGCALVAAAAFAVVAWRSSDPRPGAVASLAALALGLAWAVPDHQMLLAVGAVAFALGGLGVVRGLRDELREVAGAGLVLVVLAVAAETGLATSVLGAPIAWALAAAAAAAAVCGVLVSAALAPSPARPTESVGPLHDLSVVASTGGIGAAAAVGLHLACLAGLAWVSVPGGEVVGPATLALIVGICALGAMAARPVRPGAGWWLAGLVATEAVALVWLRLADRHVDVPEAYTLPVVVVLALLGWSWDRAWPDGLAAAPSWRVEGPALAMGIGPTALLALGDPGVTRQVVGLAVGGVALAVGAALRRRAPVDVGAAVVIVVGLQALLPYADDVPRWLSLGVAGAALVVLGATFEERRRDLGQARRRYAALR